MLLEDILPHPLLGPMAAELTPQSWEERDTMQLKSHDTACSQEGRQS